MTLMTDDDSSSCTYLVFPVIACRENSAWRLKTTNKKILMPAFTVTKRFSKLYSNFRKNPRDSPDKALYVRELNKILQLKVNNERSASSGNLTKKTLDFFDSLSRKNRTCIYLCCHIGLVFLLFFIYQSRLSI